MNEPLTVALAGLVGSGLGAMFFGGLWWTVRKGVSASQPALWFLGSWLLRTGIALVGFYVVSGGHLGRLLASLAGFALARFVVTRLTRPLEHAATRPSREAGHAP
jgi:F1F0 ATPase subunit 2